MAAISEEDLDKNNQSKESMTSNEADFLFVGLIYDGTAL